MTRTEIARRLHDMVDQLVSENTSFREDEGEGLWYPTLRITFVSVDNEERFALVVGIEPSPLEDES